LDAQHCAHLGRIVTAEADLEATEDIDLSTAGRAALALTVERLRGALAELIRSEREHHFDAYS
jgi:hypothetical protein